MKVIFLDVDGVLNNDATKERFEGMIFLEDKKIQLLKEILNQTGAKVVLTSTWRRGWYCKDQMPNVNESDLTDIRLFDALEKKLAEHGITLMSYTDDFGLRGEEIDAWLKQWQGEPIESYVILDDMDDREIQPHAQHLVQTTFWDGLLPEDVQKAAAILNAGQPVIENENADDDLRYYRVCRVRCKRCGVLLEHVNQAKDENTSRVLYCSCGAVGLDPSATLYRILGNSADYTDLSEEWRDDNSQLRAMPPQDRTAV